jgi:hypothetical protein
LTALALTGPGGARPRARRGGGAGRLAEVVVGWEGVTASRGEARLGRESLGRRPGRVRSGELDRVVEAFRRRYAAAQDAIDRRAGVRG